MRRANRPLAVALLFMAVLCSPASVCVVDGMAATVRTAEPAHAHACGKNVDGPVLTASDGTCCAEPRNGFVNVFRFTLQKQGRPAVVDRGDGLDFPFVTDVSGFGRAAPLVLRI